MTKKYQLKALKGCAYNPFAKYTSDKIFDASFINRLSKMAKLIIKYLVLKQTFTEEKFLLKIDEFNRLMGYIDTTDLSDGLAELCAKELLAKTKEVDVYWVNNKLLNTGVFHPQHIDCSQNITMIS